MTTVLCALALVVCALSAGVALGLPVGTVPVAPVHMALASEARISLGVSSPRSIAAALRLTLRFWTASVCMCASVWDQAIGASKKNTGLSILP